jgi:hypothetical protein
VCVCVCLFFFVFFVCLRGVVFVSRHIGVHLPSIHESSESLVLWFSSAAVAGQASQEGTDSMNIGKAMSAPKRGLVNEQVRGTDAGKGADFSSQFGGKQ